jgi:hypothetical protein
MQAGRVKVIRMTRLCLTNFRRERKRHVHIPIYLCERRKLSIRWSLVLERSKSLPSTVRTGIEGKPSFKRFQPMSFTTTARRRHSLVEQGTLPPLAAISEHAPSNNSSSRAYLSLSAHTRSSRSRRSTKSAFPKRHSTTGTAAVTRKRLAESNRATRGQASAFCCKSILLTRLGSRIRKHPLTACLASGVLFLLLSRRSGFRWPTFQTIDSRQTAIPDMISVNADQVTLVTAYFDVPSKRPSSEYKPWIRHMMSVKDDMVIFTTPDQAEWLRKLRRGKRKTHIVATTLDETTLVKTYGMDFWDNQRKVEPGIEKFLHSKELYIIWNMKSHWLQQAIDMNPFGASLFCWIDAGYLRDDFFDNKRLIRYIPRTLQEDQVLMLDVRSITSMDYLGGGFIGGYAKGIRKWNSAYYTMLDANKDRFIGKDQPWMFKTCHTDPELCVMIEARTTYGDPWFYMAPYLHGVQYYGPLDHLRRVWERSVIRMLISWIRGDMRDNGPQGKYEELPFPRWDPENRKGVDDSEGPPE